MDPLLKGFEENKFIAVIRSASSEDAESMIKAAIEGGFRIFEISVQTSQAFRMLENYSKKEGLLFGAGNITDGEIAQRAINSGAKFISSLYTDADVISVAKNNDAFVIQGAATPTEAVHASQCGVDLINIYPVTFFGGPSYLKFLRGPLPFLKFAASGDIALENACDYLKYCSAVYIHKAVFDKSLIRANNWTEIKARARQLTQKLEALKVSK